MSQRVVLGKWGANVAVRLPRDIVQKAGFTSGTSVEVEARTAKW